MIIKLTDEQLRELCIKRNKIEGARVVDVMTNEELASYRINCVDAIAREEKRIEKFTKNNSQWQLETAKESLEILKGYVAFIDEKLAPVDEDEIRVLKGGLEVIDEFLAEWKVKAFGYYMNLYNRLEEIKATDYEINEENLKVVTNSFGQRRYTDDQVERLLNKELNPVEISNLKSNINYSMIKRFTRARNKNEMSIVDRMRWGAEEFLNNLLDRDVEAKKQAFVSRINSKAGEILEAFLSIGDTGEINGFIVGSENNVNIKTVSAGGYNIQCFHYRMLVKVIKK